jgi:hypothetical protein
MHSNHHVRPASQYVAREVPWLWPLRLARGKLALFQGDPGLGKSLISLDLCARLSTGRPFPDGRPLLDGPGNALVINAEDTGEDTIRPRLAALGADLNRVFIWDRREHLLRLPTQLSDLDAVLAEFRPRLVVLDPITAFLERGGSSELSVRRGLDPLGWLAHRRDCLMQLVLHLNKQGGPRALYRGCGSIAFPGACRFVWMVAHDPQDPNRRVLAEVKNSYAPFQPSLGYSVTDIGAPVPKFEWHGVSPFTSEQLLAAAPPAPPLPPRDRAREFLLDFLAEGAQTSRAVWEAAVKQGLSDRTLNRAKTELDIRSLRVYENKVPISYWLLPGQELPDKAKPDPETDLEPWLAPLRKLYPPSTPLDDM